jgi:hypothetical protein
MDCGFSIQRHVPKEMREPVLPFQRLGSLLQGLAFGVLAASLSASIAAADCRVPTGGGISYLPVTTAPKYLMPLPLPEPNKPVPDCPFYQQAWQSFLYVTQTKGGKPAFLGYPTFEKVFKQRASPFFAVEQPGTLSLAPRALQFPNAGIPPDQDLDINDILQAAGSAGLQRVLIDQNGNAVFFAIHVSDAFAGFLRDYDLINPEVLKQIPAELEFRPGVLELKSAWQIFEGATAPKNYITTPATVPVFKVGGDGKVVRDGDKTRQVTAALLSLHVVTAIEGHPEFIWATFEHVSHEGSKPEPADGSCTGPGWLRDVAPAATDNPDKVPVLVDTKLRKYALYPVTSTSPAPPVNGANMGNKPADLKLDVKTQKFSPVTPVFRIFPASKSDSNEEDDEVRCLNNSVKGLFESNKLVDKDARSNYQLVGAVWLNTPRVDFKVAQTFSDVPPPPPVPPPRDPALFGGENRLSNMALESFTQPTSRQPNCFSCHDTNSAGVVNRLSPSRLNVSHVLSKFFDLQKANK